MRLILFLSIAYFELFLSFVTRAEPLFGTAQSRIELQDRHSPIYVALIVNKNSRVDSEYHLCTGTLVARSQVLTSASCVEKVPDIGHLEVIFGTTRTESIRHTKFQVISKSTYGDWCNARVGCFYDKRTDDICILRLSSITYGIGHARIAGIGSPIRDSYLSPGLPVKIVGWGHTKDEFRPSMPRRATGEVLSKLECETRVKQLIPSCLSDVVLPERVFCVASNPPVLAVEGDFGGPAFYGQDKIVSAILIQRCPSYHPHDVNTDQVNLLLQLSYYLDFFVAVLETL